MGTAHTPIPNQFTTQQKVEIAVELDDGTKIYRLLDLHDFKDWQERGADLDELRDEDEDA